MHRYIDICIEVQFVAETTAQTFTLLSLYWVLGL